MAVIYGASDGDSMGFKHGYYWFSLAKKKL
jgi:hypothetical protein